MERQPNAGRPQRGVGRIRIWPGRLGPDEKPNATAATAAPAPPYPSCPAHGAAARPGDRTFAVGRTGRSPACMEVCISPSAGAVAVAAADHIAQTLRRIGGPVTLGLAGGSTPRATYAELIARRIDWEAVTMWLSDERWVAQQEPESNIGMVRTTLVDRVNGRLLAPDHRIGDPATAAAAYEAALSTVFVDRGCGPAPDLVLLGLGEDGHTASLFPDTAALADSTNRYVANWVASQDVWRLTATLPLLRSAAEIVFIVTGTAKAAVVREVILEGVPHPAQRVAEAGRRVKWFLDSAAAAQLG